MVKGLYTAYTGMIHQQDRMDILSNNMANSATVGFKKEGSTSQAFKDVLALKIRDTSDPVYARRIGTMNLGVKIGENYTDYSQGGFVATENPYDLAIAGNGFFACEYTNKAGERSVKYTRDGSFTLTATGDLVTKDGDFVLDAGGRHIRLNPLAATTVIDEAGRIYQNDAFVAQVQLVDFPDYNALAHFGENYYEPVDNMRPVAAGGKIVEGHLEQSNVTVVSEMVELIEVSRNYEANQKMIQTIDNTLDLAVNQLGKV